MRRLFQLQSRRATPKQVNNGKRVLVWFRIFARNLEPDDLGWVNPMNRNILFHLSHGIPDPEFQTGTFGRMESAPSLHWHHKSPLLKLSSENSSWWCFIGLIFRWTACQLSWWHLSLKMARTFQLVKDSCYVWRERYSETTRWVNTETSSGSNKI